MTDITCRIEGRAGRITLNRPKALNALTWDMCLEIEKALNAWADDPVVKLLIIDGLPCEKPSARGAIWPRCMRPAAPAITAMAAASGRTNTA